MQQIIDMMDRTKGQLMLGIGSLALLMLAVGAIRWVTAGSDKGAKEGAHETVKNALIGVALAIGSPILISIVHTIVG